MWYVTSLTVSRISQIFVSEKARKEVHSIVGISDVASEAFSYSIRRRAVSARDRLAVAGDHQPFPVPAAGWRAHLLGARGEGPRPPIPFAVMERASVVGFALVLVLFMIGFTNDIHTFSNGGFHVR